MEKEILVSIGLKNARRAAKSMEFMRRNLDRIALHLPKDRHVRDLYKQLVYDSSVIFGVLHDELEFSCTRGGTASIV